MDFRKRLIVMFMIMTLFPILLLVSFGFIIIQYQANVMQQTYDTEVNTLQALQNPVQVLNRLTRGTYNELKTVTKHNPDTLLDMSYLQTVNAYNRSTNTFTIDTGVLANALKVGLKTLAVDVNIGLNDKALTDFVLLGKFAADFDHAHHRFVTGNDRIFCQIFGNNARMAFAGTDQFDVRKTQPDGINAHQQFIVFDLRHIDHAGFIIFAEKFKTGTEQRPRQHLFGNIAHKIPRLQFKFCFSKAI